MIYAPNRAPFSCCSTKQSINEFFQYPISRFLQINFSREQKWAFYQTRSRLIRQSTFRVFAQQYLVTAVAPCPAHCSIAALQRRLMPAAPVAAHFLQVILALYKQHLCISCWIGLWRHLCRFALRCDVRRHLFDTTQLVPADAPETCNSDTMAKPNVVFP